MIKRTRRAALGALGLHSMAETSFWVALMVWSFREGGASRAGLVAVISLLASAACAPMVSAGIQRLDQVTAIRLGAASQTLLAGLVAVLLVAGAPAAVVIVVSVMVSAAMTATRPAYYGLLPSLLDSPQDLIVAARKSRVAEMAGNTAGPFLTAAAFAAQGADVAFILAPVVLGASCICTLSISRTGYRRETKSSAAILGDSGSLARQLRTQPGAIGVLLLGSTHFAVVGALDILTVALATSDGGAESLAGVLAGCFSLGALTAAAVAGRRIPVLVLPGIIAGAAVFVVLLVATSLVPRPALAVSLFLAGAALAIVDAGNRTLLPRSIPSSLLGRVFGLQETAMMFGCAIGATLAPVALETLGLTAAMVFVGALPLLVVMGHARSLQALDRRGIERGEAVKLVSEAALFDGAPPNVASAIAFAMEKVHFGRDTTIIREHDRGDCLYVIAEGSADVSVNGQLIRSLGAGDHVGEVALLRNSPRTATVVATTDVAAWRLESAPFLIAVTAIPGDVDALVTGGGRYTDLAAPGSS